MDLHQECTAQHHFNVIEVPSSNGVDTYTVVVPPGLDAAVCHCPSFSHRGYCRHTEMAIKTICTWNEADTNYLQTPGQRRHHECPVCGGPTQLVAA